MFSSRALRARLRRRTTAHLSRLGSSACLGWRKRGPVVGRVTLRRREERVEGCRREARRPRSRRQRFRTEPRPQEEPVIIPLLLSLLLDPTFLLRGKTPGLHPLVQSPPPRSPVSTEAYPSSLPPVSPPISLHPDLFLSSPHFSSPPLLFVGPFRRFQSNPTQPRRVSPLLLLLLPSLPPRDPPRSGKPQPHQATKVMPRSQLHSE